jgi:hypothetical protein
MVRELVKSPLTFSWHQFESCIRSVARTKSIKSMLLTGLLIALAVVLYAAQEFLRRARPGVAWACFLALPLVATPHWARADLPGLFPWVKLYSVLCTTCWITGVRYTKLGRQRWAQYGVVILLVANITEAIVNDLFHGGLAHCINVAAGALVIVALSRQLGAGCIDTRAGYQDLHLADMTPLLDCRVHALETSESMASVL